LAFPVLIIPHFIFFFITLRYATRRILPNLLGIGLTLIPALAQIPYAKPLQAPENAVKIATYNVRAFYQVDDASKKMRQWVADQGIDVLCLQEVRRPGYYPVDQEFSHLAFAPKWSGYSVGIFSKYPIVHKEALSFEYISDDEGYPSKSAGLADIVLPWDTVRFINVHLNSTGVRDGDMSVEPDTDQLLSRGKEIARKLAGSDRVRGLQSKSIIEWIEASPHPVVLCGDFNSVPGGNLYARLLGKMEDPYLFKGSGKMGSFEPLKRRYLPIKIDWTLHSEGIESYDQHIDHINLSDHYPLVTTIGPPKIEQATVEEE
jgi:endonuclease/exonuclease/phosphatase family metal-dependent hydrolase